MKPRADIALTGDYQPQMLDDLCQIENACFSDPWSREGMEAQLRGPYSLSSIALIEGKPVGYVFGVSLYEMCDIMNVAVLPQHRREGVAKAMMEHFISQAKEKGAERILLEVRESNIPAIRLYESFGFLTYGKRENYYEDPAEDALLMVVKLC